MPLWRAAQAPISGSGTSLHSAENIDRFRNLRSLLNDTINEVGNAIKRNRRIEWVGTVAENLAIALAVAGNLWLLFVSHLTTIELISLWLPSLMGAFHSLRSHRRTAERIPLLSDFWKQLRFVRTQLQVLVDWKPEETQTRSAQREAMLRFLCEIIGKYCQDELMLAMNQHPDLPS
jgi:hypothetical protein